jgi:hypothetical protein
MNPRKYTPSATTYKNPIKKGTVRVDKTLIINDAPVLITAIPNFMRLYIIIIKIIVSPHIPQHP